MKLPSLLHHILNPDSRKVGFGWWLFIVATVLLREKHIDANDWTFCMIAASTLIGGGTLGDSYINAKIKGAAPAQPQPPAAP